MFGLGFTHLKFDESGVENSLEVVPVLDQVEHVVILIGDAHRVYVSAFHHFGVVTEAHADVSHGVVDGQEVWMAACIPIAFEEVRATKFLALVRDDAGVRVSDREEGARRANEVRWRDRNAAPMRVHGGEGQEARRAEV